MLSHKLNKLPAQTFFGSSRTSVTYPCHARLSCAPITHFFGGKRGCVTSSKNVCVLIVCRSLAHLRSGSTLTVPCFPSPSGVWLSRSPCSTGHYLGFSRRAKPGECKKCPWGRGLESSSVARLEKPRWRPVKHGD